MGVFVHDCLLHNMLAGFFDAVLLKSDFTSLQATMKLFSNVKTEACQGDMELEALEARCSLDTECHEGKESCSFLISKLGCQNESHDRGGTDRTDVECGQVSPCPVPTSLDPVTSKDKGQEKSMPTWITALLFPIIPVLHSLMFSAGSTSGKVVLLVLFATYFLVTAGAMTTVLLLEGDTKETASPPSITASMRRTMGRHCVIVRLTAVPTILLTSMLVLAFPAVIPAVIQYRVLHVALQQAQKIGIIAGLVCASLIAIGALCTALSVVMLIKTQTGSEKNNTKKQYMRQQFAECVTRFAFLALSPAYMIPLIAYNFMLMLAAIMTLCMLLTCILLIVSLLGWSIDPLSWLYVALDFLVPVLLLVWSTMMLAGVAWSGTVLALLLLTCAPCSNGIGFSGLVNKALRK